MNENDFPNTYEYLDEEGVFITDIIRDDIQKDRKVASGKLLNSIDYDIIDRNGKLSIIIVYADHGEYVLSGRKPGSRMPPVSAIQRWLKIKHIPIGGGRVRPVGGYKSLMKKNVKTINQLAWAVSKSIAKYGIRPYNFLKDVQPYFESKVFLDGFEEAMAKDIEFQVKKEIKK